MLIDHLKNLDASNLFRTIAYGEHVVSGTAAKSVVVGSDPNHQITVQQILGRDEWEGVSRGVYWNNLSIPPADWFFHPGKLSSGNDDPSQGVDTVFSTDVPHSGTPWMRFTLPVGVGEADTKNNPPVGFQGYFKTKKINDYDRSGAIIDYSYSPNPARIIADLILKQGKRNPSLIDFGALADFRDFHAGLILCDYRAIPDFDGFGLTATYFSGTNFNTFHSKRVDNLIAYPPSDGAPAYNLSPSSFSAKFEGYIKLKYKEPYTFYLTHSNGARLTVNGNSVIVDQFSPDGLTAAGTHSGTFAPAAAGTFMDVLIEWNKGTTGAGELQLEWQSASQAREVVPSKYLYPKAEMRPRYEIHPYFSTRTRLDEAVRAVLNLCDSTYQKVGGNYRFFCLEQLTGSSFDFNEDRILSISVEPLDKVSIRNRFRAGFRDVDSRFLEPPKTPILVERLKLQQLAGRPIDGDDLQFFNTTRHQAWRLLNRITERACDTLPVKIVGNGATFSVLGGDRVRLTTETYDWLNKEFLVLTSNDASSEDTADERNFTLQEWI